MRAAVSLSLHPPVKGDSVFFMPARRGSALVWIVVAFAAVLGLFVAELILTSELTRGDRAELVVINVVGSWALVAAGVVAFARQAGGRVGVLMFTAAFAWLLAALRWSDLDGALQTIGLAAAELWAAVLAHLALAFPGGRLGGAAERAL